MDPDGTARVTGASDATDRPRRIGRDLARYARGADR